MTFILSEDKALRDLLKGMKVTDQKTIDEGGNAQRNVDVWFGQPDQEPRNQSYPYIVIDMIDIAEDFSRSMRGKVKPNYLPDPEFMVAPSDGTQGVTYDPALNNWEINWPIPVNIDYQITTYSRQPRHDREILAQLMHTRLPLRFGILEPDDGTVRRLDILDISKRDVTEQGKRLFVNAFTVRVSSEIVPQLYNQVYKALQISVTGTEGVAAPGQTNHPYTAIESFTISE
jgi:hypothetical protein